MIDLDQAEYMLGEMSSTIPLDIDVATFARHVGVQALRILHDHGDELHADARVMLEEVYSEAWGVKPMRFSPPGHSSWLPPMKDSA